MLSFPLIHTMWKSIGVKNSYPFPQLNNFVDNSREITRNNTGLLNSNNLCGKISGKRWDKIIKKWISIMIYALKKIYLAS
jgi:hypothetical protein